MGCVGFEVIGYIQHGYLGERGGRGCQVGSFLGGRMEGVPGGLYNGMGLKNGDLSLHVFCWVVMCDFE